MLLQKFILVFFATPNDAPTVVMEQYLSEINKRLRCTIEIDSFMCNKERHQTLWRVQSAATPAFVNTPCTQMRIGKDTSFFQIVKL